MKKTIPGDIMDNIRGLSFLKNLIQVRTTRDTPPLRNYIIVFKTIRDLVRDSKFAPRIKKLYLQRVELVRRAINEQLHKRLMEKISSTRSIGFLHDVLATYNKLVNLTITAAGVSQKQKDHALKLHEIERKATLKRLDEIVQDTMGDKQPCKH